MSIRRPKDTGYRRSQAALIVAVLFVAAALLFALGHQLHWPVAVHGVYVVALFAVAMILFFIVRGRQPDGNTRGGGAGKDKRPTHGN